MKKVFATQALLLFAAISLAACATTAAQSGAPATARPAHPAPPPLTPAAQAAADSGRPAYTRADVAFMQGMIRHHAQALTMADWARTRASRNAVKILAARIDVAQRDEIATMERWLTDRHETVPSGSAHRHTAGHEMHAPGDLMPGMLTAEQLSQLERARDADFDRLFLTLMIQHHEGALTMVRQLFSSPGAGQDATIFRFASDVEADQTTEIDRMRTMLASQPNRP